MRVFVLVYAPYVTVVSLRWTRRRADSGCTVSMHVQITSLLRLPVTSSRDSCAPLLVTAVLSCEDVQVSMFNTRHVAPLLHYPLMALIDYRGFRLTAVAWLPLARDTLVPSAPCHLYRHSVSIVMASSASSYHLHVFLSSLIIFSYHIMQRYGSGDAGRTVLASDEELNEQMARAGTFLNLEEHPVGTTGTRLHLCGDIEGTHSDIYLTCASINSR